MMSCVPDSSSRNADRHKAQFLTINFQSKLSRSMPYRDATSPVVNMVAIVIVSARISVSAAMVNNP